MEIAWACGIAALVALCCYGILAWAALQAEEGPSPEELLDAARARGLEALQSLGAGLFEQALVPEGACQRVAEELRLLSIGGREPFAGLKNETCLGVVVAASAGAGLLCGLLSWSVVGLLLGAVAVPALLWAKGAARERALETKVVEAMPEAFGSLAISLGSGLSLPQAMRYVGNHSEEPVKGHFLRASFSMGCGVSATEALDDMVNGLSAPGLELVSLALKISQRTGAPLKDLLAEASQLAGERIELARRLDVKTAQARMSAQLVAAMPAAMVALLTLLSSDFRAGLATSTGAAAVSLALVLNLAAWMIIRRIMKVEL